MSGVNGLQPTYITNFDKQSLDALAKADNLRVAAGEHREAAAVKRGEAVDHLANAGIHGMQGVGHTLLGGGSAVLGGGALTSAALRATYGVALTSVSGWAMISENARSAINNGLNNFASWLTASSNASSARVGDGQKGNYVETEAKRLLQTSDHLYAEAKRQFVAAGQDAKASGAFFVWSFAHGLAALGEAYDGIGDLAGAGADVWRAAKQDTKATSKELAAFGSTFTALMLQAQENGVQLKADAQLALAKVVAKAADVIATSNDPTATINVTQDAKAIDLSFRELLNANAELKKLPAAQQYLAAQGAH